jgi:hypothetical protein
VAGGTMATVTIPSHEQMWQFAADLVPPGTSLTNVGQVSGFDPLSYGRTFVLKESARVDSAC